MISVAGRSANLASALKATSQVVSNNIKTVAAAVVSQDKIAPPVLSNTSKGYLQHSGILKASSGIGVASQIRCASTETPQTFTEVRDGTGKGHYDIPSPTFDDYRHSSCLDPTVNDPEAAERRKAYTYMMMGTSFAAVAYTAKNLVRGFVAYVGPAADCLAAGSIEIDTTAIPEGKSVTFKWRGKPLFVKHRTAEEIEREQSLDLTLLRDPEHDNVRVVDPTFLVVIGICTHLGCVPIADAGDYGGYYCPCHGSHYDGSGRIRMGPAPLNLEVPPHSYTDTLLIVG